MGKFLYVFSILALCFAVISCVKKSDDLKTIQEQQSGDFIISILNNEGKIYKGSGVFYLEFKNVSNNEMADLEKVNGNAVMQLNGVNVNGEVAVLQTPQMGRFKVKYNFPESGKWNLIVNYNNQKVQFPFSVY